MLQERIQDFRLLMVHPNRLILRPLPNHQMTFRFYGSDKFNTGGCSVTGSHSEREKLHEKKTQNNLVDALPVGLHGFADRLCGLRRR